MSGGVRPGGQEEILDRTGEVPAAFLRLLRGENFGKLVRLTGPV